ncbi:hypothetical protein Gogos_020223 [Gossypium gossypioides]|uniref:Uncharacterized protein n=1 Tax=Gossypium gossypioides TaxID=34282 RepID=A0A7J9D2P4_GOSGO|nr:hypothetical protein [Gossypium gossypioides]
MGYLEDGTSQPNFDEW